MELIISIQTQGAFTEEEMELIKDNVSALLKEVRPDLVEQGIESPIEGIDVELLSESTAGLINGEGKDNGAE
ncbi:hypothetical protein [Rossellomorea marisflavi]|uniref:hypothetical protein n=1 Tax=Rossellomorea marisflavi TaxID=189381 RepID=UPI003FA126C2